MIDMKSVRNPGLNVFSLVFKDAKPFSQEKTTFFLQIHHIL